VLNSIHTSVGGFDDFIQDGESGLGSVPIQHSPTEGTGTHLQ